MKSMPKHFDDLDTIRKIMERSTRFLSLSGLSGVFAGLIALAGSSFAYFFILRGNFRNEFFLKLNAEELKIIQKGLIIDALIILILASGFALFFSYRKAISQGLKMWTPVSKRLLFNLMVPLVTGGLFIIILFIGNQFQLIIPSMLIFFGLSLVNAGKFTYNDILYLGVSEVILGLVSALLPEYGLLFWTLGFGVLNIVYGLIMYRKYEI